MDIGQPSPQSTPVRARAGTRLNRRRLRLAVVLAVLLGVLTLAGQWAHRMYTHVYVDDARIAADTINIASRMPGWVAEMNHIAGDTVPRGAVLARIDARESDIALRELEARLAGIAARRAELQARIAMVDRQTQSQQEAGRARLGAARAALPAAEANLVLQGEQHHASVLYYDFSHQFFW